MLFKVFVVCVVKLSPVVLALFVALQVYVEERSLVKGIFNVDPLHIVAVPELVIVGAGLTVTTVVMGVPKQLFAEGVMVYIADPATAPVVVKLSIIAELVPVVAPETPD